MKTLRIYKEYDPKSGKRIFEVKLFVTSKGVFRTCETDLSKDVKSSHYLSHDCLELADIYFYCRIAVLLRNLSYSYVKQ